MTEKTLVDFKEFIGKELVYLVILVDKDKLILIHNTDEGRQIRNWMRSQEEFKDYTAHDYDNNWMQLVKELVSREK